MELIIEKQLGRGAFGIIYLVSDLKTGIFYALKEVKNQRVREKEIEILRKIHTNCQDHMLCYISSWDDTILTDYIVGFNLDKYDQEIDPIAFLDQFLPVLEKLQDLSIAHRDIKPENIIYDPRTNYYTLIDFGLAMDSDSTRSFAGSTGYISKTILDLDPSEYTMEDWFRNDVFSLGATLFKVLNGKYAFKIVKSFPNTNLAGKKLNHLDYRYPTHWLWRYNQGVIMTVNLMLRGILFADAIEQFWRRNI
jgi:serine/threonine-protein kinase